MDRFGSPILSKGRGVWFDDVADIRAVGHSNVTPDGFSESELGFRSGCPPAGGIRREGPLTSTPRSDVDDIRQLTDMVGQLGAQIGESIVTKLMSAGVVKMNSDHQATSDSQNVQYDVNKHEPPHVTVHVKRDKQLQTFRGDDSDRLSVQDWIDMTKTYLRNQDVPVCEQADEIMNHLLGKARDVVRFAFRSDPTLDVTRKPELIFNVLLHYFGEAPSCLPLASPEERLLARMVDMFQEMMGTLQQRDAYHPIRGGKFQHAPRGGRVTEAGCRVCDDSSHTTISHCMSERLCFGCLAPGHTRLNCPANNSSQSQSEGN